MCAPLIVGGGPAGAAAACLIAQGGTPVTLIERRTKPDDKVCGDFLSAEAVEFISSLGIDLAALSPATIDTVRLVHGCRLAEAPLPFPALGLSRRVLDEAVLRRAAQLGAAVLRGHTVRGVDAAGGRLVARCRSLGDPAAAAVFLATGKHDLRGLARPARTDASLAFKTYLTLSSEQRNELGAAVELVLFDGGYAGLQAVEGGRAVLCLLASRSRFRRSGQRWDGLLESILHESPHLARRLEAATSLLPRPVAIAGPPYGHLHRPGHHDLPGLFRLGDQACVIPSFTGDGVAIALQSAAWAVSTWRNGLDARAYHYATARRLAGQMRRASLLHMLCRSSVTQGAIAAAARGWPAMLGLAAAATRIEQR